MSMMQLPAAATPAELVRETIRIFQAEDLAGMYELLMAYQERQYPASGVMQRIFTKQCAKLDLDIIAQLADELLKRANLDAAMLAVEKGYAQEIGPVRAFYRMAVVYTPRDAVERPRI